MESLLLESRANGHFSNSKHHDWNISRADTPDVLTDRELNALQNVRFIADHLQDEYEENKVNKI